MTENKMTESEIMKALECCAEQKPCKECPLRNYTQDADKCKNKVFVDALDLINRKNAEIERLTKSNTEMFVTISKQDAEIERLKYCNEVNIESVGTLHQRLKTARSDATKEFVKRVEDLFPSDMNFTTISRFTIRHIAKEMGVEL